MPLSFPLRAQPLHRRLLALAAGLVCLGAHGTAAGVDPKTVCLAASDEGQTSRDAKRLADARRAFLVCSAEACPKVVADSCATWLRGLDALQPSLRFAAVDRAGVELAQVRVVVDGREVATSLPAAELAVDPGAHTVVFEHALRGKVERRVHVEVGEKKRVVEVMFPDESAPRTAALSLESEAPKPARSLESAPAEPRATQTVAPYVFGGAAAVSLLVAGGFYVSYRGKLSTLESDCPRGVCPPTSRGTIDEANRAGTISLVAGAVGAASLAVGTWIFVRGRAPATSAGLWLLPNGSGALALSRRF